MNNSKRITYKRARPNPLFQEWLEELHEEAKEKRSKLEPMLKEALQSLSKYPLPLHSGAECSILKGFKKQLCKFLDRRLVVYKKNLSLQPNIDRGYRNTQVASGLKLVEFSRSSSCIKSTITSESLSTKENLAISNNLYSCMGPSTSNINSSNDNGVQLSIELLRESIPEKVTNLNYKQYSGSNTVNSEWTSEIIELPAGSFDVMLLIDKNETSSVSRRNESIVEILKKYPDLKHELLSLKVGDFTWIARHKKNKDQEVVLPYIVERKRIDDLASSIKDGRFHEQKFRLRKCGLDHVIYLVETCGSNTNVGLPSNTLKQALVNTRVQDGFKVHVTNSLVDTAKFLAMMTKHLTTRFQDKDLRGTNYETNEDDLMSFKYFNKASSKTKPLTVTDTFIKMLLQLKGLSVEKAIAITNNYETPRNLIEAYSKFNYRDGSMLLSNIKYNELNKKIGAAISNKIYLLFTRSICM